MLIRTGEWNAKVQNTAEPNVAGEFDPEVRNEAGDPLIELCEANNVFMADMLQSTETYNCTCGCYQMANIEFKLTTQLEVGDREAAIFSAKTRLNSRLWY